MSSDDGILSQMSAAMQMPETGPALRRYFVNTIFDSTFVILGVIIGSAFSPDPSYDLVIATILTSSFALGISTGVSVYEAETMEAEAYQVMSSELVPVAIVAAHMGVRLAAVVVPAGS